MQLVSDNLVDVSESICQAIGSTKADMSILDSSGIEAFVTKNNPKYANRIFKQLKTHAKAQGLDKSYAPIKLLMVSSHASINFEINSKLLTSTLKDFFSKHLPINPKNFLGDTAFYTTELYKNLLSGDSF